MPLPQLRAGLVQHPVAQRQDQPAAFGNGNEGVRAQQAQFGVLPAHQRLGTDQPAAIGPELGLVMQHHFIALHRAAQFLQQLELAVGADVHRLGEERIAVPPRILGVVHGRIGVRHQFAFGGGIGGVHRDAQAGGDVQVMPIDLERLAHAGDDALGHHGGIFGHIQLEHDDELIAAQPREGVLPAQQAAYALAYFDQQLVAELVAVGIVDGLEAVQVAEHHREAEVAAPGLFDGLVDAVLQQHAVGQLGEWIVQRGLQQLFVGLGQRIGQQAGAGAHLAVEQRRNQRDAQRGQGGDDDQHGQPLGIQPVGVHRAADAAFREVGGGHAGVMHAHDGQAHHQRGQPAQQPGMALLAAQPEGDPQGGTGGDDGNEQRSGEPPRVVVDAGLHPHRGHAQVMHAGDAQPHQHRAGHQARPRQFRARHQPQRICRCADRRGQRVQGNGEVVTDRDRQVEGEHAHEVHGPDAQAHGGSATGQPPAGHTAFGTGQPAGHVQRGVRGEDGNQQRENDETLAVGAGHGKAWKYMGKGKARAPATVSAGAGQG